MNIYKFKNYRKALHALIDNEKKINRSFTLKRLAEAMSVHPPYLSNVLQERAQLNSDQLYSLCEYFQLSDDEYDYLFLLIEFERCAVRSRKLKLKEKINNIQNSNSKTENRVKGLNVLSNTNAEALNNRYITDPDMWIIKIFVSLENCPSPRAIASHLNIHISLVEQALEYLVQIGLIKKEGHRYTVTTKRIHLSKDHPLVLQHHLLMRQKSLAFIPLIAAKERQTFTGTFSADVAFYSEVTDLFNELKSKVVSYSQSSRSEKVFQINFDLFSWSR